MPSLLPAEAAIASRLPWRKTLDEYDTKKQQMQKLKKRMRDCEDEMRFLEQEEAELTRAIAASHELVSALRRQRLDLVVRIVRDLAASDHTGRLSRAVESFAKFRQRYPEIDSPFAQLVPPRPDMAALETALADLARAAGDGSEHAIFMRSARAAALLNRAQEALAAAPPAAALVIGSRASGVVVRSPSSTAKRSLQSAIVFEQ
jgi:chromosome segregation ATPase